MEIGDYTTFVAVIRSFSYCPSLVQLGLTITIANFPLDTKDEVEFTSLFVDLVERLLKLIALLVVLPGASQSNCIASTSILVSKFRPTRPYFCAQITDSLDSNDLSKFSFAHYKTLAEDQLPLASLLPYHLVPSAD